jgi:murein DD-endopeptidase MepM/ murein hydrolase activator NlpD
MLLRGVTAAMLLGAPVFSQDATVLLQRGIYLEETAADIEGAIQVYLQVLAAGPQARAYQTQAQARLRECVARESGNPRSTPRPGADRNFITPTRAPGIRSPFRAAGA